ncbi:MAG: hypothetical protein ACRYGG_01080, partial [Janthinobacterium lividum]
MNKFRLRKKSVSEVDAKNNGPSLENAPPMPTPTSRGRTFRRKKDKAEEPKKELDIQTALPSVGDFRTSLLMPNLSARFSMLREQDDPNSMLGKANDDSVLFPRRQSRLGIFAAEGLSDIAEVSSLAGSIRPPFAYGDRTNSYSSAGEGGYGTDDDSSMHGSVMGRAKPGAGNKFFGGRQKIYKVPLGGPQSKDLHGSEDDGRSSMGKALYDDDIHMSTFQAMRATRKQEGDSIDDHGDRSSRENERRNSPPIAGYNRNRETSSSTNSGPPDGRTSTAATSIASQGGATSFYASANPALNSKPSPVTTPGLDRPTKGKRLYGQALDQQMHEQQSSALNRLNSIQQRAHGFGGGVNGPNLSRSTSNLNERFQKAGHFSPVIGQRSGSPASPAPSGFNGFDFGVAGDGGSRSASKDRENLLRETPPMSPQGDPTLVAALEPNDLGKATASGFLNKPKTPYSEQQFAQRQLQLQEGRGTPSPRAFSRTEAYSDYSGRLRNGSLASVQSAQSSRNQFRQDSNSRAPSNASNEITHSPYE